MLKAAIEKIESMVRPEVKAIAGTYFVVNSDGTAKEIRPELDAPETLSLRSLDALVQMIQREAVGFHEQVFVEVKTHESVECFTRTMKEERWSRQLLYTATAADVPGWDDEVQMPFERAAIALQTRFQDSNDRTYTMQLLSQITTGAKVTYNDIGVATTVVSQRGVSLQENQTIKPVVTLKPYRTFQEVEQPAGRFLIRISERGITFIEADGGMWKLAARQTVKAYLEEALQAEIQSGAVTIML